MLKPYSLTVKANTWGEAEYEIKINSPEWRWAIEDDDESELRARVGGLKAYQVVSIQDRAPLQKGSFEIDEDGDTQYVATLRWRRDGGLELLAALMVMDEDCGVESATVVGQLIQFTHRGHDGDLHLSMSPNVIGWDYAWREGHRMPINVKVRIGSCVVEDLPSDYTDEFVQWAAKYDEACRKVATDMKANRKSDIAQAREDEKNLTWQMNHEDRDTLIEARSVLKQAFDALIGTSTGQAAERLADKLGEILSRRAENAVVTL